MIPPSGCKRSEALKGPIGAQLKNSNLAEAREFLYGTFQTFALQMWIGAQLKKEVTHG